MNLPARKRLAILGDLRRLVAPLDVLYTVGNIIYRRSLRYTLVTAGIALVGLFAGTVGLPGLTVRQAALLPLVIGTLSLTVGTVMKVLPALVASHLLTVAQAADLNLMEDHRKAQANEHLSALWERLFRYESRLRLAAEADRGDRVFDRPGQTEVEAFARARRDFFARAHEALTHPLPQIRQMHRLGLDLRFLEDWRDGAWLDRSDTKLIEQFDGSAALAAARAATGMVGLPLAARFGLRRRLQWFWFVIITRMVAIQVGSEVRRLNALYDTDSFNCQLLLWPGTEDSTWLEQFDGAREEVLRRRRRVLRRIFGEDYPTACDVLDHMLYCSFALATELRMRFDPDYCDGSLDYDVLADLRREGRNRRDLQRAEAFTAAARRDLAALARFLADHRADLLAPAAGERLRAVRIAFHTDRDGLKRLLTAPGRIEPRRTDAALAAIDRAAADADRLTRRLVSVRMHHELTRIARAGYRRLLKQLAYSDGSPRRS